MNASQRHLSSVVKFSLLNYTRSVFNYNVSSFNLRHNLSGCTAAISNIRHHTCQILASVAAKKVKETWLLVFLLLLNFFLSKTSYILPLLLITFLAKRVKLNRQIQVKIFCDQLVGLIEWSVWNNALLFNKSP